MDPREKLVYLHDRSGRPWWHSGRFVPKEHPRDIIWDLEAAGHNHRIQLTFDLRTLKLYARLIEPFESDE